MQGIKASLLPVAVAVLVNFVSSGGRELYMEEVGKTVVQLLEKHLSRCHLVLLTTEVYSPMDMVILRLVNEGVVVAATTRGQNNLSETLWGNYGNCRTLILNLNYNKNSTISALRLLERIGYWKLSETRVLVVGGMPEVKDVLLHHSFRNTVNALYLAINPEHLVTSRSGLHFNSNLSSKKDDTEGSNQGVWVYLRCMYCNNGEAGVKFLVYQKFVLLPSRTQDTSFAFFHGEEQFYNFGGRKLTYISSGYFPYVDFPRHKDEVAVPITPYDSVDVRMADTFAQKMNFTYTMLKEPDNSWGEDTDGVWTGLMGYLQREDVDMSTIVVPTAARHKAAKFIRAYPTDHVTLVSLGSKPLPRHLAFVRPFQGPVWMAVMMCMVVWALALWWVQWMWSQITGGPDLPLDTVLLYAWGALLEVHPKVPTYATSGQVMVGCWLIGVLVIYTGFESELISHLTVNNARTKPPETLEDLVNADDWTWGIDHWFWTGVPLQYFTRHTDPIVVKVYNHLEVVETHKGLKRILNDGFSLLGSTSFLAIEAASYYGDGHGNTPFFISNKYLTMFHYSAWGFRLGAPFYYVFLNHTGQLQATGIIKYWIRKVSEGRIKSNREMAGLKQGMSLLGKVEDEDTHVVLGLDHLQGAFYILFMGSILCFLCWLGELLIHPSIVLFHHSHWIYSYLPCVARNK